MCVSVRVHEEGNDDDGDDSEDEDDDDITHIMTPMTGNHAAGNFLSHSSDLLSLTTPTMRTAPGMRRVAFSTQLRARL